MTLENVRLSFRLGDTWTSPAWAILVNDQPVNLSTHGWKVRCQARRLPGTPPIFEWTSDNGKIVVGSISVQFGDTGQVGETSTVQLRHSASESDSWSPFSATFEIEIERTVNGALERHTIVAGRISGIQDFTDQS